MSNAKDWSEEFDSTVAITIRNGSNYKLRERSVARVKAFITEKLQERTEEIVEKLEKEKIKEDCDGSSCGDECEKQGRIDGYNRAIDDAIRSINKPNN